MHEAYQNHPLRGPRHIRVLQLQPSSEKHRQIECRLQVLNLDSRSFIQRFEALSYQWGQEDPECFIICNGKRLNVTPNCKAALTHLRHQIMPRRLWVDAICIDQTEEEERSHQVDFMGHIYSAASTVIAWLGEGNTETEYAIRVLKGYGNFLRISSNHPSMPEILKSSVEKFELSSTGKVKN